VDEQSYPSRNEEYLLYQTLLGTWPLDPMSPRQESDYRQRIVSYMLKAMREAKMFTSWLNPSQAHEQAMTRFVETVLSPSNRGFREDFLQLHADVARYGMYNSLAQLAIKVCAPGVPDFYQGSELWDFTLVDPDNRRPVDYERRARLLAEIDAECAREGRAGAAARLLESRDDRVKLFATTMLLRARQQERDIFTNGDYNPVEVQGSRRDHVFAFARSAGQRRVIVTVPRLAATLASRGDAPPLGERVWGDTELLPLAGIQPASFHDVITDRCVPLQESGAIRAADVFARFPIAVLVGQ
jgi:(1->4)-alpha-D-glucan 1-alpha-D-glucosylmutase